MFSPSTSLHIIRKDSHPHLKNIVVIPTGIPYTHKKLEAFFKKYGPSTDYAIDAMFLCLSCLLETDLLKLKTGSCVLDLNDDLGQVKIGHRCSNVCCENTAKVLVLTFAMSDLEYLKHMD